jgi:carbamoyl-phosphate synthase large subunit
LEHTVRLLLTGAGSPAAPGVIKSLRSANDFNFQIIGIDCNPHATGFHMVDRYYVTPRAEDAAFIPSILEICKAEQIDLLFSLVTSELEKLSLHSNDFYKQGTALLLSEAETIRQTIHKGMLYERLRALDIAVPDFEAVQNVDMLKKAIDNLGYPKRPVCFKPAISDGSRGFHILDAQADRFRSIFEEKPNSAYISYSELLENLVGHASLPELIVMEFMPNEEYSVDILADHGKVLVAVPRLREGITSGITTRSIINNETDIIHYASEIVEKLGLHGIIGVQVRRDVKGNPKIVEINPRIQGTSVHCTAAGVNLPLLGVKQALGFPISDEELSVRWGTRMVRYWEEVFYDTSGSSYAL